MSTEEPKLSKTNIPVRPQSFTGRSMEMHTLINELLSERFVTITGTGGIGKTTVAMEVARWFSSRGHFPDGIFHIDLRKVDTGSGIIGMLGAILEVPLTETKDLIVHIRERQCLFFFDNAEEVLWKDEDVVHDIFNVILMFAPRVKILISSQRHIGGDLHEPERVFRLGPINLDHSACLFLATTKRLLSKQEWESDVFHTLLMQVGGLPLSIILMARQLLPGTTIEDLIERIKAYKAKAIMVKIITERDPEHGESLVATLLSAYNNLSSNAKTLFQILSMLPAGAQKFTIERIMGDRAWEYAQELHDSGLSEITTNPHIFLLPPVTLFAQSILTKGVKKDYAPKIVELMGLYAKQFYEHLGAKDAREHRFYFVMEEPNLRFAVDLPCSPPKTTNEPSALGVLAPHLISLYIFNNRYKEAKDVGNKIIFNIEKLGDILGEANTLMALGDLAVRTANLKDAKERYEKALGIFQQIDAKLGEANTLMRLGQWFALTGELNLADNNLTNAFMIYEKIAELDGQADVHMGRALVHLKSHADARAKQELDQCSSIRNIVYAHGEAAQWLIFYADHLKLLGFGAGARICLDYAREFACKALDLHLQNRIKQRCSEILE